MADRTNQQCQHFNEFPVFADRVNQEVVRTASRGEKAKVEEAVPTFKAAFLLRNSKPLSIANSNCLFIFQQCKEHFAISGDIPWKEY